jgi:hypothetical protein
MSWDNTTNLHYENRKRYVQTMVCSLYNFCHRTATMGSIRIVELQCHKYKSVDCYHGNATMDSVCIVAKLQIHRTAANNINDFNQIWILSTDFHRSFRYKFCGSVHESHNPHLTRSEKIQISCTESAILERITAGCCHLYFTVDTTLHVPVLWGDIYLVTQHKALPQFFFNLRVMGFMHAATKFWHKSVQT